MRSSYRWLQELLGNALPDPAQCAERLTLGGLEVEGLERHGAHLERVLVARVLSSRAHPTSKNPLTLVSVELAPGEVIEVVCGAPNVPPPGGLVCFAPVGATLFDKKGAPFELTAKPIAGVVSTGMLCAEDELGLGSDHGGILVLEHGTPGQSLLTVWPELDDHILVVNVTPNRPDALGHRGLARELAALCALPWSESEAPVAQAPSPVSVTLHEPERCPRYAVAALEGVRVGPAPLPVRVRLTRLGVRPINSVVDATSWVMLERGQPLHAFSREAFATPEVHVRLAREGETLEMLDGQTRTLHAEDLVIASADRVLALAGVMGGEGSGVHAGTTSVVLESAYFAPRGVRRTARRHGMHTEASHRYEREVDPAGPLACLAALVATVQRFAGGTLQGGMHLEQARPVEPRTLALRGERTRGLLGVPVTDAVIERHLRSVGCGLAATSLSHWTVTAPTFRPDLTREVDLIEEVGRLEGYHNFPGTLAPSQGTRSGARRDYSLRRSVRNALCAAGLDEAVHYGFLSAGAITTAGFELAGTVRVSNPLSEEHALMRPSLVPQLLHAASHAVRHGEERARLFEVGSVFGESAGPREQGRPGESTRVAGILLGHGDAWLARPRDVDFFDAKGVLEALAQALGQSDWSFVPAANAPRWAHPAAVAEVLVGGRLAGYVGEAHPDVRESLRLPRAVVLFELALAVLERAHEQPAARVPGRFPTVHRDVALLVASAVPVGALQRTLREGAGALCKGISVFDRYAGSELPEGTHSLAFSLALGSDERTLAEAEIEAAMTAAVEAAKREHHATQR